MILRHLAEGLVVGFSIAAPVGPIGVLCIRTALHGGARSGFVVGLGAATADAAYGAVAGFGLSKISGFLVGQRHVLAIVGGLFLLYLGVRTFLSRPGTAAAAKGAGGLALYGSTLLLTLSNPATILSFIMFFAASGAASGLDTPGASVLVLGVFLGSVLWWAILSSAAGMLRSRVTPAWMTAINRVSGAVLAGFGVAALALS